MNTHFAAILILSIFFCAVAHEKEHEQYYEVCDEYSKSVEAFMKENENSEDFPKCLKNLNPELKKIDEIRRKVFSSSDREEKKKLFGEMKEKFEALSEENKKAGMDCHRKIHGYLKSRMTEQPSKECKESMEKIKDHFFNSAGEEKH